MSRVAIRASGIFTPFGYSISCAVTRNPVSVRVVERLRIRDGALPPIAEIVHEIDLKDSKFGRPETPGIERLIAGIAMANRDDEGRLTQGSAVFEALYEYFRRKRE